MNSLGNHGWVLFAFLFIGVLVFLAWLRWRERRWIADRFKEKQPIVESFGVGYFGCDSEPGNPRRSKGFLLLMNDRMFYRSRFSGIELDIPGDRITRVHHGNSHKGADLHQSVMKIDFLNEDGIADCAAFRVPYPPQWIQAIRKTFRIEEKK